ncbi:hypothetical protein J2Z44_000366 [Clostridium punense]|uniref:Nitroreductase domain-containing protein n=1 Tax=Clostridium punense TaxID=1054297 RepID=A0ABS4JYG5_9CLOT|nr:hypothetical protein [Clostridium punense]MBP2020582.1 hypothetical protein [Clostridium punense]
MDFMDLAKKRYSVRKYKSDPVEKEKLMKNKKMASTFNGKPFFYLLYDYLTKTSYY